MPFCLCRQLELKIVPVAVFAVCVGLMLLSAWLLPIFGFYGFWRFGVGCTAIFAGCVLILLSIDTFHKAQTPKTPNKPEVANQLVSWGIYAYSRNPMYLGGTFIALGVAFLIGNYSAFLFVILFMGYIDCFQIRPEERILERKFPQEFSQYTSKTRRWF